MPRTKKTIKRRQRGRGLDIQKLLSKTGIEDDVPGSQYLGLGTKLKKRLARGDPGKNRLDRIAKQHDIDYSVARNLRDKGPFIKPRSRRLGGFLLCLRFIFIFIFFNRAAEGGRGSRSTRGFFFRFVGELNQTSARPKKVPD